MASTFDYQLLLTSADLTDDADFAGTQTAPSTLKKVDPPDKIGNIVPRGVQLEIVVEWLTSAGVIVAGAGSFTLRVVKVIYRGWLNPKTSIVVDSAAVSGQGSRPILISDMRVGDEFAVRITGITAPATTDKYRVLYREVQG